MGTKELRQRESDELKRKILDAAKEILVTEGYRNLSVRKIGTGIGYSAAAIYHYFKDKDEIVSIIVAEGYGDILKRFAGISPVSGDPGIVFRSLAESYVELVLANRNLFRAVLLDDIGSVSKQVWMLEDGISKKRETIASLSRLIEGFIARGVFRPVDPELAALSFWCAVHGLVVRLLVEEPVSEEFRKKLLAQLVGLMVAGLGKREE